MPPNTPPETLPLRENAISHCVQARVQVANHTLSTHFSNFWSMPRDAAMRDLRKVAISYPLAHVRIGTENVIKTFEQGNPMLIQAMQEENPGCTVQSYIALYKYILENLDEFDAEARTRLETITDEEIIDILTPPLKLRIS